MLFYDICAIFSQCHIYLITNSFSDVFVSYAAKNQTWESIKSLIHSLKNTLTVCILSRLLAYAFRTENQPSKLARTVCADTHTCLYSKTCVKQPLKNRQKTKIL